MAQVPPDPIERSVAEALRSPKPFEALRTVAESQVARGVPQTELLAAFQAQLNGQVGAPDEMLYNALADVMDFITGWCAPEAVLYKSGQNTGSGIRYDA